MKLNSKITKGFLLALILCLFFISCSNETKEIKVKEIYVAINGNDNADGSISKPYATLLGAVNASRDLRKSGLENPIVIYLREGRHQLNQTLVLGIEDGRPENSEVVAFDKYGAGESTLPAYLTISAYPEEHPVVSAGVPIINWKRKLLNFH